MDKSILDTDILSEYLKGHHRNVVRYAERYAQEHGVFTFTSVTVYEICLLYTSSDRAATIIPYLGWQAERDFGAPAEIATIHSCDCYSEMRPPESQTLGR